MRTKNIFNRQILNPKKQYNRWIELDDDGVPVAGGSNTGVGRATLMGNSSGGGIGFGNDDVGVPMGIFGGGGNPNMLAEPRGGAMAFNPQTIKSDGYNTNLGYKTPAKDPYQGLLDQQMRFQKGQSVAQGASGIGSIALGAYQYIKGKKLDEATIRPTYVIPQEIKDKLSSSQLQALEGLPADQKKQYVDNLQRNALFSLNAMGDRKAGVMGLSTLTQNMNDASRNLLTMDANARMQNQRILGQTQSESAGYTDKAFDINKMQPYVYDKNKAAGMMGAGINNVSNGINGLASSAALLAL